MLLRIQFHTSNEEYITHVAKSDDMGSYDIHVFQGMESILTVISVQFRLCLSTRHLNVGKMPKKGL